MSRNNSNRLKSKGPRPQQQTPQPPLAPPAPPGMSFVVPTEHVDLPTRGLFYSKENSLYGIETIEIKHMTAKEEDILANQDYISKGLVFDKLIEAIVIDKTIKVSDLSEIDKIAILVQARKTGYGDSLHQMVSCTECGHEHEHVFSVEKLVEGARSNTFDIPEDIEVNTDTGNFSLRLPISGFDVVCRVMNNDDFKYIQDLEKQRKKHSLDFNYTIEFLRRIIIEVSNESQTTTLPAEIGKFLEFIPARDSKKLKASHNSLIPNFIMTQEVECPNCSNIADKEVPFSWAIFWNHG